MNPFIGSSLYDSLNRLVIGILASLIIYFPIFQDCKIVNQIKFQIETNTNTTNKITNFQTEGMIYLDDNSGVHELKRDTIEPKSPPSYVVCAVYLIICFLIGIYISIITDKISTNSTVSHRHFYIIKKLFKNNTIKRILKTYISILNKLHNLKIYKKIHYYYENFFYKNNISKIVKISSKYSMTLTNNNSSKALYEYYDRYYTVQKKGLLGNIPALEALSAFLLNICTVCILYIFVNIGSCFCVDNLKSPLLFITTCIIIIFLSSMSRNYLENKIYSLITLAYKYIKVGSTT